MSPKEALDSLIGLDLQEEKAESACEISSSSTSNDGANEAHQFQICAMGRNLRFA